MTEFNQATVCWAVLVQRARAWKALDPVLKDWISCHILSSLAYPVRAEENVSGQGDRLVAFVSAGLLTCSGLPHGTM